MSMTPTRDDGHIPNQARVQHGSYITGSPVSTKDLHEALEVLRYDVHREVQTVVREQVRQFGIAKQDMEDTVAKLGQQMAQLLRANEELRKENERLRRIY